MGEPAVLNRLLSVEEYLRMEMDSPVKHEYVAGRVFAMVGVTRRHSRIVLNMARKLDEAAERTSCRVSLTEVKLQAAEGIFYYPDIIVACGQAPGNEYLEDAPCLLVEVTSHSTATVDRREKLSVYQRIPTLRTYLIVAQDERHVERYWRDERDEWHLEVVEAAGTIPIPCPETQLTLDEIYARLE